MIFLVNGDFHFSEKDSQMKVVGGRNVIILDNIIFIVWDAILCWQANMHREKLCVWGHPPAKGKDLVTKSVEPMPCSCLIFICRTKLIVRFTFFGKVVFD